MSTLQALILGIIQGITEFFPVSSSGHLELGQIFFGFTHLEQFVFFNLVCHLGTLFAIVTIYAQNIRTTACSLSHLKPIIYGTLPLFPLVFFLRPLKEAMTHPQLLGFCFLTTAVLLAVSGKFPERSEKKTFHPFIIGLFQAFAVLPGISRSGATISGARILGWNRREAVTFSFLLAIPAILGGIGLEGIQIIRNPSLFTAIEPLNYFIGFLASFTAGFFSLKYIIQKISENRLQFFVWYCVVLGAGCILWFSFNS